MRWSDFERTIVWSGVTFERTIVWSEVILSAQSSGQWSGFELGYGRTIVWTMVWLWSDQMSFPSEKVWSETVLSALRAHTVFRAHFSLIKGYFGLGGSDQGSLPDGTSTWDHVSVPQSRCEQDSAENLVRNALNVLKKKITNIEFVESLVLGDK